MNLRKKRSAQVFCSSVLVSLAFLFNTRGRAGPSRQMNIFDPSPKVHFDAAGYTDYGEWAASAALSPAYWRPGKLLIIDTTLGIADSHLGGLAKAGIKADGFCLLVTAERSFDAEGRFHQANDERMSTLLTPTGLAIEGGIQGAVTPRFGYAFRTPVDELMAEPLAAAKKTAAGYEARFELKTLLPMDLPPGIYRVRLDYGFTSGGRFLSLNGEGFASRPFFKGRPTESHLYSPPIPANGLHASGHYVYASDIRPRVPWVLLSNYNSNGYRGVIADEDKPYFALSPRNIISDDVILPLYDDAGRKVSYSLEPQFPVDTIEARSNIPWDYASGFLSIQVTQPDGKMVDLGTAPFIDKTGIWPTTKRTAFTQWRPPAYGHYIVKAVGWISDIWGNRYEGGGTFQFWIAKRMTLATATFQGVSYPVGGKYGRDLGFSPAVPADVRVDASLFVNSDSYNVRTISYGGKASPAGIFGFAQGAKPFTLDSPGEYLGHVLATYTDPDGHLWVSTMRHSGVVYPEESSITARGKKLYLRGSYVSRGETRDEGWTDSMSGESHLVHITFPYLSGDALLIASEQQASNKIEPVLTYEDNSNPSAYDPAKLRGVGVSNLAIQTSNGYSPHLFPEYITDWAYYYAGAPRPGFMSRFLVGESNVRAPYWPTSPNSFGGQIGTSANGDLPGDIYRLLGVAVLRKRGKPPAYAGYMASAFILPKGTKNNRVIAPGSEDIVGSDGKKARLFLVTTRPGMVYETGTLFTPVAQIDPILPAQVTFWLTYPDGRQLVTSGACDSFGSFAAQDRWTLDIPGVYRFWIEAEWQGQKGYMPGVPPEGGLIFVIEKDRPNGAPPQSLALNLAPQTVFSANKPLTITGMSNAAEVSYAAVIPGAAIEQGKLAVSGGMFTYVLDPVSINKKVPIYDIMNLVSGKPEIGKIVHLTFFSKESDPQGLPRHSFIRLIIRGQRVLYAR